MRVRRLVLDRRTRRLLVEVRRVASALYDVACDDTMKDGSRVEALVHVLQKVLDRDGRFVLEQLDRERPERRLDDHLRVRGGGRRLCGGLRLEQQQEQEPWYQHARRPGTGGTAAMINRRYTGVRRPKDR